MNALTWRQEHLLGLASFAASLAVRFPACSERYLGRAEAYAYAALMGGQHTEAFTRADEWLGAVRALAAARRAQ